MTESDTTMTTYYQRSTYLGGHSEGAKRTKDKEGSSYPRGPKGRYCFERDFCCVAWLLVSPLRGSGQTPADLGFTP